MADIVAASFSISAVATAAPHEAPAPDALAHQLGLADWTWLATVFFVVFAALLSVGGHLAPRIGPRRVLGTGLVIYAASTAAMMAAPAWLVLLVARVGQAGGAALMIPASLGLLIAHLPQQRQRAAIGWWSGAGAAGTVMLHAGGGVLVATLGWRALFLPGLMLTATLVCFLPLLPRDYPSDGHMPDLLGALLLVGGISALVLAICQGAAWGWASLRILLAGFASITAMTWALWRSRTHPRPAVPLHLWRHGRWRWGWAMSFLYGLAAYPILGLAPSYLAAMGYDAWWASLLLCPLSVGVMMAGPLAGISGQRWGSSAVAYVGAALVVSAGSVLSWTLGSNSDNPLALAALAGLGAGLGALSAITASVGSQTPQPEQAAVGSAASMTARQGGGAVGVAGASVLLQHPFIPGPAAGGQTVLAACLAAAGLCGLLAVARPLARAFAVHRAARHITPQATSAYRSASAIGPPLYELLAQLHTVLIQAAQATEEWMTEHPARSTPAGLQPGGAHPTIATETVARNCSCHPELDAFTATILHSAPALREPRHPFHLRIQPAPDPERALSDAAARNGHQ